MFFSGTPRSAAISRAMPKCESKSGRFGVISQIQHDIRRIQFGKRRAHPRLGGKISKPSAPSPMPSSLELHSIPWLSTPRSLPTLILKSPGNTAPGSASGTLSPTR